MEREAHARMGARARALDARAQSREEDREPVVGRTFCPADNGETGELHEIRGFQTVNPEEGDRTKNNNAKNDNANAGTKGFACSAENDRTSPEPRSLAPGAGETPLDRAHRRVDLAGRVRRSRGSRRRPRA